MNTSLSVTNLRANAAQSFPITTGAKANQNDDPVIIKPEVLQSGNLSLSTSHSTLIRFVQANTTASTTFAEGIKLSNAIDCLKSTQNFNSEMKTIVLKHIEKSTSADKKITTLEKGLEFLETEQKLSNLVNKNQMSLNIAKEILTKCLDLGCQKDFDLGKLREFNTFLDTSEGKNVSEKLGELFNHSEVNHQPVALQSQTEATEEISHSSISLNTDEKDLKKATFTKLGECFEGSNKRSAIQATIQVLINKNNGEIDKKLFNTIQETLEKNFGIDKNHFNKAWAEAISTTQGGEIIKNDPVKLRFGGQDVKMQMTFTPQVKMSGFTDDTTGMKHCSSMYQGAVTTDPNTKAKIMPTTHAVNLWKQDIALSTSEGQKEVPPMSFLRHGYILEQETAAKEILANACVLQHGEAAILKSTKENPLSLNFTNVQLMSFGNVADKDKPWKQMEMFNRLAANDEQLLELKYREKTVYVKFEKPLLFNFGVNMQHFRHLEIRNSDAKKQVENQNLESFKQLFGENFPNIVKAFGTIYCNEGSLIKNKLDSLPDGNPKKQQIQTLANQILDIYQSHPEGLKDNPYALPTRVLALTNLLGYASSFNCKSGKDRTGVCAMELSNLCARMMMTSEEISDPTKPISDEEQANLQAIYKEGSCVRDIPKINTVLQSGLKTDADFLFKYTNNRFGIDLTKSFDSNVEKLDTQNQSMVG